MTISFENVTVSYNISSKHESYFKDQLIYLFKSIFNSRTPDPSVLTVLDNLSFTINDGDRLGIIGRNGAGKSTLLKTICGIYPPLSGKISVTGNIAPLLDVGAGFHPDLTAIENIFFNSAILGASRSEASNRVSEILEFAGLTNFQDLPVKYYSTGMYMKLAFSLATAFHPDILILDELFVGGDVEFISKGRKRMSQLIDSSRIMVLVSHDPNLLRSFCNRFLWLEGGSIVEQGSSQVLDHYLSKYVNP